MLNALKVSIRMFGWYIGESWQWALVLLALLYLLICKNEKEKRKVFVGYAGVFLLLYLCPITAKIIMDYCIGELVYWRMFWILPIPVILAYAATRIWQSQKNKIRGGLSLILMFALIMGSGRCVYGTDSPFQKAGNLFKIPPEVCWVCDVVKENTPEGDAMKVIAPAELVSFIRQYEPGIELAYGRNESSNRRRRILAEQMLEDSPDFTKIARIARKLEYDFLIYPSDEWQDEKIQGLGYEAVGNVNTYIIYKDKLL